MPWSYDFIHSTIYKQLKAQVTAYTELKLAKKSPFCIACTIKQQTAVLVKYTTIQNLKLTLIQQGCIKVI